MTAKNMFYCLSTFICSGMCGWSVAKGHWSVTFLSGAMWMVLLLSTTGKAE